jgi:hypothetical protein
MRVLASTVHRVASDRQTHGFLVEIDWTRKLVLRLIEAPPIFSHFSPRNRGGRRGLRGITHFHDLIWVASCDALLGLSRTTLELDRVISHPWMAHVHEIVADSDGIWVTSTGGNGVFKVGVDQRALEAHWLNGEPVDDLRVHLDRARDVFHINTVFDREGVVFAYSMVTGQVFRPRKREGGDSEFVPFAQLEAGCHNVVMTEHGWFRNESATSTVHIGSRSLAMPRAGLPGEFTQPGWLRGMALTPNGRFLVGSSPATIYEIDPAKMEIVDAMSLSEDVCWTIHGLFVDDPMVIDMPSDDDLLQTQARLAQLVGRG